MKIKLRLTVSGNALPAEFTVRDFNGNIVFYQRNINAVNCFEFCANSRRLIFTVRPINTCYRESSYFLTFPCAKCVSLSLGFVFLPILPTQRTEQNFTLYDATYCFPVQSAILSFISL